MNQRARIDTRLRYMACQIERQDASAPFLPPAVAHTNKRPTPSLRPEIDTAVLLTPVTLRISMGGGTWPKGRPRRGSGRIWAVDSDREKGKKSGRQSVQQSGH